MNILVGLLDSLMFFSRADPPRTMSEELAGVLSSRLVIRTETPRKAQRMSKPTSRLSESIIKVSILIDLSDYTLALYLILLREIVLSSK